MSQQKPYKETLNLPETQFPMKANAAQREPEFQTFWDTLQVYQKVQAQRKHAQAPRFLLHDGPPYLSSDKIHIGTALNKILKDIVTRYKTARGYYSPFVPGYDAHGLPIENAVVKTIKGGKSTLTEVELRRKCREFALGNLTGQEAQFKRLGVWGNWEQPYLTIRGEYEATQIELFGTMVAKGYVYKGLKPVYWSIACETALAEAEVEYETITSPSIYVAFPVMSLELQSYDKAQALVSGSSGALLAQASLVIWTTTPWTLPGNVAIAANKAFTYRLVQVAAPVSEDLDTPPEMRWILIAEDRLESFLHETGYQRVSSLEQEQTYSGEALEGLRCQHPFIPQRHSVVVLGDHVTLEAGTGLVHTAPGHGLEDYQVVTHYNRLFTEAQRPEEIAPILQEPLPILSPVDGRGLYHADVIPEWLAGTPIKEANTILIERLTHSGHLLCHKPYQHSYPHCWRSHTPLIFRATEQWFVSVGGFRQEALEAIDRVTWLPAQGRNRIYSMVEGRSDWCISRQRAWGVPIPAFYCDDCGTQLLTKETTQKVAAHMRASNSDVWWEKSPVELLGEDLAVCPSCGSKHLRKETDIMDVWFDSGVSHTAVVAAREDELGTLPVDLYLEGSDQHRGWFQSSLLTSMMAHGEAPYKSVLTHGFVLDEKGQKMSKSLGNVVDPNQVTDTLGADVLRLWVASVDYTHDVRIGKTMLQQLADAYRKIRNTTRFLLGNLADYDPAQHRVSYESLGMLDRYVLARLSQVVTLLTQAFDRYEFHQFYQLLQPFCVIELSSLYLDIHKDVLYCHPVGHPQRRAVQTVMEMLLRVLTALSVPVMPHLAEDIFQHWTPSLKATPALAQEQAHLESAMLLPWPVLPEAWQAPDVLLAGVQLLGFRDHVNKLVEQLRSESKLASVGETVIHVAFSDTVDPSLKHQLMHAQTLLVDVCMLADVVFTFPEGSESLGSLTTDTGLVLTALKTTYTKCERCWRHMPDVGDHAYAETHATICGRCAEALHA
ncbi:MAG: isoleucine--tRNA ligase [Vampirovibrionales bacterium]